MNNTEHGSEVARLLQQIDQECEAARRGLSGLALGTARHDFITARLSHMVACQEQLATHMGEEEAARLLVEHYVQAIG